MKRAAIALAAALTLSAAGDPAERLADPRQEAHARSLFRETRCLVCQGESIDESDAPLAADLRRVIRGKIAAGASDSEIRAFLAARYGDFVLLRPPWSLTNLLLWVAPFLVALGGLAMLVVREGRAAPVEPDLTAEDEARIHALTNNGAVPPESGSKNALGITER